MMEAITKALSSRKFWAAVAASVPFALAQQWDQFAQVWLVYIGAQGAVDVAGAIKGGGK